MDVITIVKTMIVNKNEEERLVTLPLLIPDYEDCDAHIGEKKLSIQEIQDFSHKYMEKYRIVDGDHDFLETKKEIATPVESWQLREDTAMKTIDDEDITYPEGTWMATLKVHDDEAWDKVKDGRYNGGSVTVLEEAIADKEVAKKIAKKAAAKKGRVLIKDIPDPAVATIALVDKPCVFGAKFCTIKTATKAVANRENSVEGKRDKISAALRKLYDDIYIELTFDDKVIVHSWKDEAYYEIPYSIGLNDEVQLGEPTEVEVSYVAKKMLESADIAKKAGRSISESTFKKIKNAFDSLGKLMDKANDEREETPATKSDKMTKEEINQEDIVTKKELDTILDEKFKAQEEKIVEAVKSANETDETKKEKKIGAIKKDLEDLGIDTSEMEFSVKETENDNDNDVVSKKEYDELALKNKEYAEKLGIDVDSQALKEKPGEVSTKSVHEQIMESAGRDASGRFKENKK